MARSYFSRLVSPSPATALQPPRPIASLWKTARLDHLAGVSIDAREAGPAFADASEGTASRPARLVEQKADDTVAVPRLEPLPSFHHTVEIEQKGITLSQSKTLTAKGEEQESRRERLGKSSGAIEEAAPLPTRRDREREMTANAIANREPIAPTPVPAPLSLRTNPGIDAGRRTTAEKNSSLRIGKIEVQIVPSPRSSSRPAHSPKPAGRLARGYALWTNWQQQ
jgi:hypothetical protein